MKKALFVLCTFFAIFTLVSCASISSEPTVVGQWTRKEDGAILNYFFTEDGYCAIEYIEKDYSDYTFGQYEIDGDTIYGDLGPIKFEYVEKGINFDGEFFKRVGKAVNNSEKIAGVWTNDEYSLGIATDGLIISQGRYMNCNTWEAYNNEITAAGKTSDYVIINSNLYIDCFKFLGSREVIKLQRKSSLGSNKSTTSILCSKGPWFYYNPSQSDSGTVYSFSLNGHFEAYSIEYGQPTKSFNGSYTFEDNRVHLSNGNTLIFGFIDETPFGYN